MVRNTHYLGCDTNNPVSGPCTEMILYEIGVNSINNAVDGNSWMIGIRSGGGRYPNNSTGLENKFAAEVVRAISHSGMKREDANEIVKKIIPKYEEKLTQPDRGKTFPGCFDVKTLTPTKEWSDIYEKVWKEFEDLGVDRDKI